MLILLISWMKEKFHGKSLAPRSENCMKTELVLHTEGNLENFQSWRKVFMQILCQDVFVKQDSSRDAPQGCLSYDVMAELQSKDTLSDIFHTSVLRR